jgi:beta-lactamase regulating signal transducer with metallopeptidase domain
MESLLSIALSNALAAAILAAVVLLTSRLIRCPALIHGLWLLVLLKLVTPPLFFVPVRIPSFRSPDQVTTTDGDPKESPPASSIDSPVDLPEELPPATEPVQPVSVVMTNPPLKEDPAAAPAEAASESTPFDWLILLGILWATGSLGWLLLAVARIGRMQYLLRFARSAPEELVKEVHDLAGRLGLSRLPSIWLVPGKVSPMVWSLGRVPRLLLPAELLRALNAEQRATLLVHELAHLRRGDHWVRWLELLTATLYWWNPIVWLARHELREAEEQCCDAWVVSMLPSASRAYADALLECLDYLSDAPHALPVGASGLGHVADLKRRLKMILACKTVPRLSWGGSAALMVLGVLLLPLFPTWAEDPKEGKDPPAERKDDPAQAEKARAEIEKLRAELADQLRKVGLIEGKLREAARRLHPDRDEARSDPNLQPPPVGRAPGARWDERAPTPRDPAVRPDDRRTPRDGGWRIEERRPDPVPQPRGGDRIGELERKLDTVMRILEEIQKGMRGTGTRLPVVEPPPVDNRDPNKRPANRDPRGGDDQRIQRLEQRMDAMMRALEELQRRMGGSGGRTPYEKREYKPASPVPVLPGSVTPRRESERPRDKASTPPRRETLPDDRESKPAAPPARER